MSRLTIALFACQRPSVLSAAVREALTMTPEVEPRFFGSLKGVDLSRFAFDYDLALAALAQTPTGVTVSRWGHMGATATSFSLWLERAKKAHWPQATVPKLQTLSERYPRFASTPRAALPCYHCHYAHDAQLETRRSVGTFTKRELFRYPPPSCLGLTLTEDGVTVVQGRGLVRAGDRLIALNGTPLYSEADLRFALDPLPDNGATVVLAVERQGQRRALTLWPPTGWRTYDISARPSQGAIPPILGFWEEPVAGSKTLALKITTLFPGEKWRASQGDLRLGDVIVGVDGKTLPAMSARQFHSWFRLNKEVGQKADLLVVREGKRLIVTIPCLDLAL